MRDSFLLLSLLIFCQFFIKGKMEFSVLCFLVSHVVSFYMALRYELIIIIYSQWILYLNDDYNFYCHQIEIILERRKLLKKRKKEKRKEKKIIKIKKRKLIK